MNVKLTREVETFISSLEETAIAKVLRTIDLLELFGNKLGMPHSKKVDAHLFELRIRGKQEVRIFYTFRHNEAILIHAFVKKSQKTPRRELQQAQRKMRLR